MTGKYSLQLSFTVNPTPQLLVKHSKNDVRLSSRRPWPSELFNGSLNDVKQVIVIGI
jgi:hypothetical protein